MERNNTFRMIKDYVKWRVQSVNAHGLHSPFMYNLATRCFYDNTKYPDYKLLKAYHKKLLKNKVILDINDLGAGSKKMLSNKRKISDIAKIAGSSFGEMKLWYRLTKYFGSHTILELGTSLGKATYAMALANLSATIITVEGDENLADFSKQFFQQYSITNIEVVPGDFDAYLDRLNLTNQTFDLVFLDGNHRLEPTLRYFKKIQKHLHNDSVVILDDIYWSNEMKHAWQLLKQHKNVQQTIDAFSFGMLFFRKEQFQEHFVIRV